MKPGMGDHFGEDQQQCADRGDKLHPALAALLRRQRLEPPLGRGILADPVFIPQ